MTDDTVGFWDQPEQVETFAARQADKRLVKLIESYEDPGNTRILDLGCAAGRNVVLLAEQGFDVYAMDASPKMVEKTRERVGSILNSIEAKKRILCGRMDDLQTFQTDSFHLVISLGLYQNAISQKEFDAALAETARVLIPETVSYWWPALARVAAPAATCSERFPPRTMSTKDLPPDRCFL